MRPIQHLNDWLEAHWVTPAYAGWVLLGITGCFLLAASNTLAGWLYVLSGLGLAMLAIAAYLPLRSLQGLEIHRSTIFPVSAGGTLHLDLTFTNKTTSPRSLLQIQDQIPATLGCPVAQAIDSIPPLGVYTWRYTVETRRRGVYRWPTIQLRTAAPLGLFWCRRLRFVPATAMVYPIVLELSHCPVVDWLGQDQHRQVQVQAQQPQRHSEGTTRALRPYRWGDPMRLVHWRSSARYQELRTRELEVFTGGDTVIIALDSAGDWRADDFEQAVMASASLFTYANQRQTSPQLWTAGMGYCQGYQAVLERLAQVEAQEAAQTPVPIQPMIWLTANPASLKLLPPGSRWLLWLAPRQEVSDQTCGPGTTAGPGLLISSDQPLRNQLQGQPR